MFPWRSKEKKEKPRKSNQPVVVGDCSKGLQALREAIDEITRVDTGAANDKRPHSRLSSRENDVTGPSGMKPFCPAKSPKQKLKKTTASGATGVSKVANARQQHPSKAKQTSLVQESVEPMRIRQHSENPDNAAAAEHTTDLRDYLESFPQSESDPEWDLKLQYPYSDRSSHDLGSSISLNSDDLELYSSSDTESIYDYEIQRRIDVARPEKDRKEQTLDSWSTSKQLREQKLERERIIKEAQNISLQHGEGSRAGFSFETTENDGNFRALLRERCDAGDVSLKTYLQSCSLTAKCISSRSQNRMILSCGKLITEDIVNRANAAKAFTIIVNETSDVSRNEMISLSVRFLDETDLTIRELFLGFKSIVNVSGRALADAMIKFMQDVGLDKTHLRGQAYDGALMMSGNVNGLRYFIKKELNEKAVFTHCASHSLNLACSSAASFGPMETCLQLIGEIILFISNSTERCTILKTAAKQLEKPKRLTQLLQYSPTRWVQRHAAIERFVELSDAVFDALREIRNGKDKKAAKQATELASRMSKFEFVVSLSILNKYAKLLSQLASQLEKRCLDLMECCARVEVFRVNLDNDLKTDDSFDTTYAEARAMAHKLRIPESFPLDVRHDSPPLVTYYRDSIYRPYIKSLQDALQYRFEKHDEHLYNMRLFIPAYYNDGALNKVEAVVENYKTDIGCDVKTFMVEFRHWMQLFLDKPDSERPYTVLEAIQMCRKHIEPNVYRLLKVFATMPVTTATAERSFSTMKRVKTYLRSSMSDESLNSLALLNIHRDINISVDAVYEHYMRSRNRRILV